MEQPHPLPWVFAPGSKLRALVVPALEEQRDKRHLLEQPVIGADETGFKLIQKGGSVKWQAWQLSCPEAIYFEVLPSKHAAVGEQLFVDVDTDMVFGGTAVMDGVAELRVLATAIEDRASRIALLESLDRSWDVSNDAFGLVLIAIVNLELGGKEPTPAALKAELAAIGDVPPEAEAALDQVLATEPRAAVTFRDELELLRAATALRGGAERAHRFLERVAAWEGTVDDAHHIVPGLLELDL